MRAYSRIYFRRISIKGYRGRYLDLTVPEGKNNAVFVLDGNTGKTTIIELLRWCFTFKESEAKGKFRHMWDNPAHVLDFEKEGAQSCSIIVYFKDENQINYKYERVTKGKYDKSQSISLNRGDVINSIQDSLEINNGAEIIQGDGVIAYLNTKFRLRDSSQFCFFDGEKARDMMRIATSDVGRLVKFVEIRTTHETMNYYQQQIENLKEKLLNASSVTLSEMAQKQTKTKLKNREGEETKLKRKTHELDTEIETYVSLIQELDEDISELNREIISSKSASIKRKTELEHEINDCKKSIIQQRNLIYNNYSDIIKLEDYSFFNLAKDELQEKGKFPEPYRTELIQNCIDNDECQICGRPLDNKSRKIVTKLGELVASHEIHTFLTDHYEGKTSDFDPKVIRTEIRDYNKNLEEKEFEFNNIDLDTSDLAMMSLYSEKKSLRDEYISKQSKFESDKEIVEVMLQEVFDELSDLYSKDEVLKRNKPLLEVIDGTTKLLATAQKKMKSKTIKVIERVVSDAVQSILGPSFSVSLTEKGGLMLGENDHFNPEIGGYSGRLILSYLFAEAMSQVNSIIIDTPVGNIGSHRDSLANHLNENHEQVILLCLPTELENFASFIDDEIIEIENGSNLEV